MLNEAPQEQPCSARGLSMILKAARMSSVWKSTVEPFKYSRDVSSITTLAPSFSNTLSSSVIPSVSKSNLY